MPFSKAIATLMIPGLLFASGIYAQYKFDKAVVIDKENGLPVNTVRSISKGEDGFIWIGTSQGLCRFDGLETKVFREGADLESSLFDNSINVVLAIKDEVWIGTSQGLSVLNTKNLRFRHYQFTEKGKTDSVKKGFYQQVSYLYLDKYGKIWIGTTDRGVAVYDESRDDFRFFSLSSNQSPPLIPALGSNNSVLSIVESGNNDSVIWAGTEAGLQEINRYTGKVDLYTYPRKSKDYQIALNAFRRLYFHDDGLLYVGSWAAGVNLFDPVSKTFTPLEVRNKTGQRLIGTVTGNITRKSEHEIWISTLSGLVIYDSELKDVTWYKLSKPEENEYYGIGLIDDANRIWFGAINGLNCYDPAVQQFSSYSFKDLHNQEWAFVFYILSDSTGNHLTICPRVTDGIYYFDKIKKEWSKTYFPKDEPFVSEREAIRGFVELSPGEYIISADKGIYRYSKKRNRITVVNAGPPFLPTRRGDLMLDRSGYVWFSDDVWGLTRWDPRSGNYTNYRKETIPSDTVGSFNRLYFLFEDSHGNIWFQRADGMGVYVAARDTILNFEYKKNNANSFPSVVSFAEDRKGRVWATGGAGELGYALSKSPEKGLVYKLNDGHKNIELNLRELATDPQGNVWGYNLKELIKINADDLSRTSYSFQYGASNPDFFKFSFLPSGEVIFGGRKHITIANPSELKRNTEIPEPYISEFQIYNQPFHYTMNNSPLNLRYKQNFFSIGFSAKAFTMPGDVLFRYRLSGFDDWSEPTGRRFANYTNVPGGDYVFQLQAANNEGQWNEEILELPLHIATPFWMTWWFRFALVAAVAAGVYWLYKFRINQVRRKQQLKSEYEKKLANVEMSALLAQMNPHFLFNSLNSIDSYIIRNESKKASEYLNNFARLMRLILQNSRSNYISLKDELESLDLYLQMENLRFKDKFSYSIHVSEGVDQHSIVIPPMLIQPYVENAIWHGLMHKTNGEPGKVELEVTQNGDNLLCVVQDNGIGRKKAEEIRAKKQSSHKRSMGMQITHDRIEIINKLYNINTTVQISDLENGEGESCGTRVELTIPV